MDQNTPIKKLGKYLLIKEIGQGFTGTVYCAIDLEQKIKVAIKKIPKTQGNDMSPRKFKKYIENEKTILYLCRQKQFNNIIQVFDSFVTKDAHYIVLEYCEMNLFQYVDVLKRQKGVNFLEEKDAIEILIQINQAMIRLHENFIYHRDLKPENILINLDKNDYIRISDFGFSRILQQEDMLMTGLGTQQYMAPEIRNGRYNPKQSDMYSLGVILYQILCCKNQIQMGGQFDFGQNLKLSNEMKELIEKMVQQIPSDRLKWEELGNQNVIKKYNIVHSQELNNYYLKQWENKINVLKCCLQEINNIRPNHLELNYIFCVFENKFLIKIEQEIQKQLIRIESLNLNEEIKTKQVNQLENDLSYLRQQINLKYPSISQEFDEKQNQYEQIIKQYEQIIKQYQQDLKQLKEKKKNDVILNQQFNENQTKLDSLKGLLYKVKFCDDYDNDFFNIFEKQQVEARHKLKFEELLTKTQHGLSDINSFFFSLQFKTMVQTRANLPNPLQNSEVLFNQKQQKE